MNDHKLQTMYGTVLSLSLVTNTKLFHLFTESQLSFDSSSNNEI